jgi:hypothetical protein
LGSVADPDFYPSPIPELGSWIPDQKTAVKERDEKNLVVTFFIGIKFTKFNIILFLECRRKKFGPIFKEL